MKAENPVGNLTPYDLRHLAAHLEECGRLDDLHRLLRLEWNSDAAGRRNAWFERRTELGDLDGYLKDVRRAWRLAGLSGDVASETGQRPSQAATALRPVDTLALQVRYALAVDSINSKAQKTPPALLAAQVKQGLLRFDDALAAIRQMPDAEQRSLTLKALIPGQSLTLQKRILDVVFDMDGEDHRAKTLSVLAPFLEEELLDRVEEALAALSVSAGRSAGYLALARRRTGSGFETAARQALSDAAETQDRAGQAEALANTAEFLQEPSLGEVMQRAVEAAMSVEGLLDRATTVAKLAPTLARAGYTDLALSTLDEFTIAHQQQVVMKSLLPFLSEETTRKVLAWARKRDEDFPCGNLYWVVPHQPEPLRRELLEKIAHDLPNAEHTERRLNVLRDVVSAFDQSLLDQVLPQILSAGHARNHAAALAAWCDRKAVLGDVPRALEVARAAAHPLARSEALAKVSVHLQQGSMESRQILAEALEGLRFGDEERVRSILSEMAPLLTADLVETAATVLPAIDDRGFQAFAIALLAENLPETARTRAITEAVRLAGAAIPGRARAFALLEVFGQAPVQKQDLLPLLIEEIGATRGAKHVQENLARLTPNELLDVLLLHLRGLDDARQADMLIILAPRLGEERLRQVLEPAVSAPDQAWDNTAGALVEQLGLVDMPAALSLLERPLPPSRRAALLHGLASAMPDTSVERAIELAEGCGESRLKALIRLYPRLARLAAEDALAKASAETAPDCRAQFLIAIAPHMSAKQRELAVSRAFQVVRETEDPVKRLDFLSGLAACSEGPQQQEVLEASDVLIREIPARLDEERDHDTLWRLSQLLAEFSGLVQEPEKTARLRLALTVARKIYIRDFRAIALNELARFLPEPLLREAISYALQLDEGELLTNPRGHALGGLLPRLAELGYLNEALTLAQSVKDPIESAVVMHLVLGEKHADPETCRDLLYALGERPRSHLLAAMFVLAPAIFRLGGQRGIDETLRAVADASAWWP